MSRRPQRRTSLSSLDSDHDVEHGEPVTPLRHFQLVRESLRKGLESNWTERTIIGLSVLDFVLCFVQIAWLLLRDTTCECRGTCAEEEPSWLHAFDIGSLVITGAFVVEIPLDLVAFGLAYYSSMRYHFLHIIDSLIILVAFVLELVLEGSARELASLITILRLWRVVKLISTAEVGMVDYNELTVHEQERELWMREKRRMEGVVDGLKRRLGRYEARKGATSRGRYSEERRGGSESDSGSETRGDA